MALVIPCSQTFFSFHFRHRRKPYCFQWRHVQWGDRWSWRSRNGGASKRVGKCNLRGNGTWGLTMTEPSRYVVSQSLTEISLLLNVQFLSSTRWTLWRHSAGLRIDWSGFKPRPAHFVVFLCNTLLSQCLTPPGCINGYRRIKCWG